MSLVYANQIKNKGIITQNLSHILVGKCNPPPPPKDFLSYYAVLTFLFMLISGM